MMGHREKLKSGDEYDAFLSRHYHKFRAGVVRKIKKLAWKRVRQKIKSEVDDIE